jgi:hypothetical protein
VTNNSALIEYPSIVEGRPSRSDPLVMELARLADTGRIAGAAEVCAIGWQRAGERGFVRAPTNDLHFEALSAAAFALLANQVQAGERGSRAFRMSTAELTSRLSVAAPAGLELAAAGGGREQASAIAILLSTE